MDWTKLPWTKRRWTKTGRTPFFISKTASENARKKSSSILTSFIQFCNFLSKIENSSKLGQWGLTRCRKFIHPTIFYLIIQGLYLLYKDRYWLYYNTNLGGIHFCGRWSTLLNLAQRGEKAGSILCLHNLSIFLQVNIWHDNLEKHISTGVSQHNGGLIKSPPETLHTMVLAPMMLRDASLSTTFFSLILCEYLYSLWWIDIRLIIKIISKINPLI